MFQWYRKSGRHTLPWRNTTNPYHIFVSEIMLQQTQVDTVIAKYRAFLKRFPSWNALARAGSKDVLIAWKGLGYNRRALNLWKSAQMIVTRFHGKLPDDPGKLRELPGVGPYMAESLRAFVYRKDTSALDTNIRRVVHRVMAGPEIPEPTLSATELVTLSQRIVPHDRGYEWNSALMDLGSQICKMRPLCEQCPLKNMCRAYPEILHRKRVRKMTVEPHPKSTPSVPNRIYRGRIVELLRTREYIRIPDLGPLVKPDFSPSDDSVWLEKILTGLARDGLIQLKSGTISFS